jgi:hypothetical protein
MSSDLFENWYRGYSYHRPFMWTLLSPRQRSEWMSPRRNSPRLAFDDLDLPRRYWRAWACTFGSTAAVESTGERSR